MTTDPPPIEQKVLRIFGREQAYWTANGALFFFALSQILWGFSPRLSPTGSTALNIAEAGVALVAFLAVVGMALHVANNRSWLARWCYLFLSFSTALTTVSFFSAQIRNAEGVFQLSGVGVVVIALLLTTGGLVTISMHVEHGGRRTVYRTKEERLRIEGKALEEE